MTKKIVSLVFVLGLFLGVGQAVLAQPETLNECVKIRAGFTVPLTTDLATEKVTDVIFQSGAVVGSAKDVGADNCTHITGTTKISGKCTGTIGKTGTCYPDKSSEYGVIAMLNTVYTVTNWIFFIMTIVAVLMIVYGGFVYITAAGDPAGATKGKGILTFAIIGLAIALIAKLVPSLVRFILGM